MNSVESASGQLEEWLRRAGVGMGASECHGMLTGLICAEGTLDSAGWLQHLMRQAGKEALDDAEAEAVLRALHGETVRQLGDATLDFHLLVPSDDALVAERTEALAEWCQGFLSGLGLGGLSELDRLPEESAEATRDLAQIAQAADYEVTGDEEDEQAYSELMEYVRTAVLLINEELNPIKAPPRQEGDQLH
jgi:yecA family protein